MFLVYPENSQSSKVNKRPLLAFQSEGAVSLQPANQANDRLDLRDVAGEKHGEVLCDPRGNSDLCAL